MSKKIILNVVQVIMIILAIVTLIPAETAGKANILGYYSICSFAPFSTLILIAIAGVSFFISKKSSDEYTEDEE